MILSERQRTISALGIVQIFAWGSTYYLMAVLAAPIGADLGWSPGAITAGISLGLLVSGLAASRVGLIIQVRGGRQVLVAGMVMISAGLTVLGLAESLPVYLFAWALLGLGMSASLYDAAFSTLGRHYGSSARSAITVLTLWGGFASTVCWPISAFLVEAVGWRMACFAYALLHLTVTLPLCWFALPRGVSTATGHDASAKDSSRGLNGRFNLRFWCIALAGTVLAVLASVWSIHLITILTAEGYALAAAVGLGTLIGPAQVGARILEMMGRGRHHAIWTMIASTALTLVGFIGLYFQLPAAAALVAYGAGNGLWSIARGSLPLALFGPHDYPRIMGRLATPMLIAAAAAPMLGAFLIEAYGARDTLLVLAIGATIPCLAALVLSLDLLKERKDLRKAGVV